MEAAKIIYKKLTTGQSANDVTTGDTMVQYHTLITMGGSNDVIHFTLNGIAMVLPGGFEMTRIPISTVTVGSIGAGTPTATNPGLLLIGKESRKTLFNV